MSGKPESSEDLRDKILAYLKENGVEYNSDDGNDNLAHEIKTLGRSNESFPGNENNEIEREIVIGKKELRQKISQSLKKVVPYLPEDRREGLYEILRESAGKDGDLASINALVQNLQSDLGVKKAFIDKANQTLNSSEEYVAPDLEELEARKRVIEIDPYGRKSKTDRFKFIVRESKDFATLPKDIQAAITDEINKSHPFTERQLDIVAPIIEKEEFRKASAGKWKTFTDNLDDKKLAILQNLATVIEKNGSGNLAKFMHENGINKIDPLIFLKNKSDIINKITRVNQKIEKREKGEKPFFERFFSSEFAKGIFGEKFCTARLQTNIRLPDDIKIEQAKEIMDQINAPFVEHAKAVVETMKKESREAFGGVKREEREYVKGEGQDTEMTLEAPNHREAAPTKSALKKPETESISHLGSPIPSVKLETKSDAIEAASAMRKSLDKKKVSFALTHAIGTGVAQSKNYDRGI